MSYFSVLTWGLYLRSAISDWTVLSKAFIYNLKLLIYANESLDLLCFHFGRSFAQLLRDYLSNLARNIFTFHKSCHLLLQIVDHQLLVSPNRLRLLKLHVQHLEV